MNTKVIKIIAVGFLVYVGFAAVILHFYQADPESMNWQERETFNQKQIGTLNLGVTKDEVIRLLGSPDISEAKQIDSGEVQVLFYRTHHVKSDGITTRDECTPLLFKDDKLTAWGADAYSDYQSY